MGWFVITIALPLVVPVALLLCMAMAPIPVPAERMRAITLLKDGQLCWAAIGFCASALYELTESDTAHHGNDFGPVTFGLILLLLMSGLTAVCGAVFPTELGCPPGMSWYRHYRLLAFSAAIVIGAGILYATVHYGPFPSISITAGEAMHDSLAKKAIQRPGTISRPDPCDERGERHGGVCTGGLDHPVSSSLPLILTWKKIARAQRAMLDGRWAAGLLAFPSAEQAPQHATDQLAPDL